MTDELDPQTQQHIDDSADVAADTDAATCNDTDVDDATLDNGAATEIPTAENADEQNDDSAAQDDAPEKDAAPQAEGPIEVSSEEELDAVMDSMMDAVKAMKNAVADADIDAEEEEAAEAASTFVPGETPVADQGSTLPSFLQLEHPTIGADAVDPHAAGFSVVEGGTGSIATPQTPDAGTANVAHPTALHTPAASRDLGGAVSNTASAVGAFIAQGASAMREMNAAKKALADARAHLAELEQRIADQGEELKTRQDIAGRYDQIVAEQRQTIDTAQKAAAAAEIGRDTHAAKATELKAQLEQIKEEDDATERRLKAALDAVEAREASSRETGNRLVRRLEDSKRIRDKVQAERDAGVAAAQQTVDATRAQLETLRREYAELQRNPSANPANYTVRTSELSMQISDTADALRKAEEDVPHITADLEHSLAAAEHAVEQAQAPIADARRAHQAVTAEADAARDELQTAKAAAATRQRELREKIAVEDKARREQEQAIANAQADVAHAQSIIEQATEVHDHPEITESLAGSLARDKAEHAETEREVAQLEAAEDDVRERTRDSRIKFTGAIVCIIAVILVIVLIGLFASK
jgi:chromosome segregation ATPase